MRSHQDDRQEKLHTHEVPVPPKERRPFAEPVLVKHERLTRITLVSEEFEGGGGSGATFF